MATFFNRVLAKENQRVPDVVCLIDRLDNLLHHYFFFAGRMPGGASINRTGMCRSPFLEPSLDSDAHVFPLTRGRSDLVPSVNPRLAAEAGFDLEPASFPLNEWYSSKDRYPMQVQAFARRVDTSIRASATALYL